MALTFVDTHSHLAMLEHTTPEEALVRARANGVRQLLSVSTDEPSWESNCNLAQDNPDVFYTIGLHPHDAIRFTECAGNMYTLFEDGVPPLKCVAIGELGLDYHYDFCPRDVQVDVLGAQFRLATRVGLPVIIHCRDAWDDLFSTIEKVGLSDRGGVLHCFTGGPKEAEKAISLGLYISFSGILTFRNAEAIREAAAEVPLDRVVVETDCPYLAPLPHRGKPNEPSFLPITARKLAEVKKLPIEAIAEATTRNARLLFQLPEPTV